MRTGDEKVHRTTTAANHMSTATETLLVAARGSGRFLGREALDIETEGGGDASLYRHQSAGVRRSHG